MRRLEKALTVVVAAGALAGAAIGFFMPLSSGEAARLAEAAGVATHAVRIAEQHLCRPLQR